MREIASIARASKATISKYLKLYGFIVQKPGASRHNRPQLAYGEKRLKGEIVAKQSEMQVVNIILELHEQGLSFRTITRVLNKMRVPTKL